MPRNPSVTNFGNRLYAALAGVDNPEDAVVQPPPSPPPPPPLELAPPQKLRQPSERVLPDSSPDRRHHHHHYHSRRRGDTASSSPSPSKTLSPPELPVGVKRGRHCRTLPDKLAEAAAVAVAVGGGKTHCFIDKNNDADKLPRSEIPDDSSINGGEGGAELRGGGVQFRSLGQTVVEPTLPTPVPTSTPLEPPELPKSRRLCRPRIPQAWKGRLRRSLAAGREPSEMFLFPALGR